MQTCLAAKVRLVPRTTTSPGSVETLGRNHAGLWSGVAQNIVRMQSRRISCLARAGNQKVRLKKKSFISIAFSE